MRKRRPRSLARSRSTRSWRRPILRAGHPALLRLGLPGREHRLRACDRVEPQLRDGTPFVREKPAVTWEFEKRSPSSSTRSSRAFSNGINKDLGETFYYARRFTEAIAQFERTLELEPESPPALMWLARSYEALGRHDEAVAVSARRLIAAGPRSDGGQQASETVRELDEIYRLPVGTLLASAAELIDSASRCNTSSLTATPRSTRAWATSTQPSSGSRRLSAALVVDSDGPLRPVSRPVAWGSALRRARRAARGRVAALLIVEPPRRSDHGRVVGHRRGALASGASRA